MVRDQKFRNVVNPDLWLACSSNNIKSKVSALCRVCVSTRKEERVKETEGHFVHGSHADQFSQYFQYVQNVASATLSSLGGKCLLTNPLNLIHVMKTGGKKTKWEKVRDKKCRKKTFISPSLSEVCSRKLLALPQARYFLQECACGKNLSELKDVAFRVFAICNCVHHRSRR